MDKNILREYTDACELARETEREIRKLEKKKKEIVQMSVKGSSPDFPYEERHFKVRGTAFTAENDSRYRRKRKLLEQRRADAERIRLLVEEWMFSIPARMQRIVTYRYLEGLSWKEVAVRIGKNATENGIKKEFERFMKKN